MKYKLLGDKSIEEVIDEHLLLFHGGDVFVYREEDVLSYIGNVADKLFFHDFIHDYRYESLVLIPFKTMEEFLTSQQIKYEVE